MKFAICISGLARGNIKRNIGYLKKAFPDVPMFFSSWEEHKNDESERYNSTYYHFELWKANEGFNWQIKLHLYCSDVRGGYS